jgi:hypothetical protein
MSSCPFCGDRAKVTVDHYIFDEYGDISDRVKVTIECPSQDCMASMQINGPTTDLEMIKRKIENRWNRRE